MELVDLSHYDVRDEFTAFEIANLVVGEEPEVFPDLPSASPKARAIYKVMKEAYVRACSELHTKLQSNSEPAYFGVSGIPGTLPSLYLWDYFEGSFKVDGFQLHDDLLIQFPFKNQHFLRADIEEWLSLTGYKNACYFLKKEDVSKIDKDESVSSTASVELRQLREENRMLRERLEALEKEPSPRSRNTLLVVIAALCAELELKKDAAACIETLTEMIGARVSDDTIRPILSEIAGAVERRKSIR
jgi:hypothetical protein